MNQKKVCIVTAARSEYGLLRWVIDEVHKSSVLELQLVVTGGHLSEEQGYTYKAIEADGYPISAKVDIKVDSTTQVAICKAMAVCQEKIADIFSQLHPDVIVVLGDRYELLPICSAALILSIPIAHVAGGDITEGALDNSVRNAVTMMGTYHFPGTYESGDRVSRMLGTTNNVFVTGETNIDNFNRIPLLSRAEIASLLGIDSAKKWVLCTYHSETLLSLKANLDTVKALANLFCKDLKDYEIVITKSNADFGGTTINEFFAKVAEENVHIHQYSSLGQARYISILYQIEFMIGNSSSGIFESPFVGVPCINIGDRQKGRIYSSNIQTIEGNYEAMKVAVDYLGTKEFIEGLKHIENPYGDGYSSERIVEILKRELYA